MGGFRKNGSWGRGILTGWGEMGRLGGEMRSLGDGARFVCDEDPEV